MRTFVLPAQCQLCALAVHGARHHRVWHAAAGLQAGEPRLVVDHLQVQVLQPRLGGHRGEGAVGQGADVEAPVGLRLVPGITGELCNCAAEDVAPAQRGPREDALGTALASRMTVNTSLEPALALVIR